MSSTSFIACPAQSRNPRLIVEVTPLHRRSDTPALDRIAATRGTPAFVRFDNGPEFIARAVAGWCRFDDVATMHRSRVAVAERVDRELQRALRDKLLNSWQFDTLLEAQVMIEDWRIDYNTNRPHSAHGDLTPAAFTAAWTRINQPLA